jgi:hypothetical protein
MSESTTLHITEAELDRDVRSALASVERGDEVIVEHGDHRAVAVIRAPQRRGRPITDILEEARSATRPSGWMKTSAATSKKSFAIT